MDAVPAVQVGSLPPPPHTENVSTAQEVLEKARSLITPKVRRQRPLTSTTWSGSALTFNLLFCSCHQMEKALVSLTQNAGDADGTKPVGSQNPAAAQPAAPPAGLVPSSLKGVSQSLLDRVGVPAARPDLLPSPRPALLSFLSSFYRSVPKRPRSSRRP